MKYVSIVLLGITLTALPTIGRANVVKSDSNFIEFDAETRKQILKDLRIPEGKKVSSDVGVVIIDDNFGDPELNAGAYPDNYEIVNSYSKQFLEANNLPTDPRFYSDLIGLQDKYTQREEFGPAVTLPPPPFPMVPPPSNPTPNVPPPPKPGLGGPEGGPDLRGTKAQIGYTSVSNTDKRLPHGLVVLQSLLAVTGRHMPGKVYLLNGNAAFNFLAAARYARKLYDEGKIKTVINAQSFTSVGMGDGLSPIDRGVADAIKNTDIKWYNSAGNDGEHVWAGKAKRFANSDYIQFQDTGSVADQMCRRFKNKADGNKVTVSLVYNGRQESLMDGLAVNYDMEIVNPQGNVLLMKKTADGMEIERTYHSSQRLLGTLDGVKLDGRPGTMISRAEFGAGLEEDGTTTRPKEEIVLSNLKETKSGSYCIRVRAVSGTRPSDDLQIVVRGELESGTQTGEIDYNVDFLGHNRVNEMFSPATAEGVISVGNLGRYSSVAKNSNGRQLPSLIAAPDLVVFQDDKLFYRGTSFTAPMVAGDGLLIETDQPLITPKQILSLRSPMPGPVTMSYLRNYHRSGKLGLVDDLLKLTGYTDKDLTGVVYPSGLAVVVMPVYPAQFKNLFPTFPDTKREMYYNQDYFLGYRAEDKDLEKSKLFTYYRTKQTPQEAAAPMPWANVLPYLPFRPKQEQQVQLSASFDYEDFFALEKKVAVAEADKSRLDVFLREGTPRNEPKYDYYLHPVSDEALQTIVDTVKNY